MEIEILTKNEINILNNSPKFAYEQKKYYFNINANLLKNLLTNYKIDNIAYFMDILKFQIDFILFQMIK